MNSLGLLPCGPHHQGEGSEESTGMDRVSQMLNISCSILRGGGGVSPQVHRSPAGNGLALSKMSLDDIAGRCIEEEHIEGGGWEKP